MRHWQLLGICSVVAGAAWAQKPGAYSCIDEHGNRLVADRPIAECRDREQRVLGPTGVERPPLTPILTKQEREQAAQQAQRALLEQKRHLEQQRLDKALLLRYPNRTSHDRERAHQVLQLDELQALAYARLQELELAYLQAKKDVAIQNNAAAARKAEREAHAAVQEQKRSIELNEINRQRTLLRFDDELQRLEKLWAQGQP